MSDRMTPIPFDALMEQLLTEYERDGSVFGVRAVYRHASAPRFPFFGETLETPIGPAAGPHTQLAQNIVAAYAGGARFFELKTVQTLDGEDLPVAKPCILAADEGYNVEWSTELRVEQAMSEYIKAWYALKLISVAFGLGSSDGFVFNMSVGYDLAGIQTPKLDGFIEGLKNARKQPQWAACERWALRNLDRLPGVDERFLTLVSPNVCQSITLSTLHGCPPDEIERIARYLLTEKHLTTFVKCNPTLLGYAFVRQTMDSLGYDELVFDDHHFREDLQFQDAVPMLTRLQKLADELGLGFGVKLSNTFPVTIARDELPGSEMYMSGKALYPLTVHLAARLARAFDGKLRVSYSGGADAQNVRGLLEAGAFPITMATTLLKPGGYARLCPIAGALADAPAPCGQMDANKLDALAAQSLRDPRYRRPLKPESVGRIARPIPPTDCFAAPCASQCPIHQDIAAYLEKVEQGRYSEALQIICEKNPLPNITGTLCTHRCQSACTCRWYDESVQIRAAKLLAAEKGADDLALAPRASRPERVAVLGGGPAGMAAAFLLAREGARVTIFEKRDRLGGVVRYVIPRFRIADEAIQRDAALLERLNVEVRLSTLAPAPETLFAQGYTHVLIACGAWAHGASPLDGGKTLDALSFLEEAKLAREPLALGKNVVIVGGGNTAMDAARVAKRQPGVQSVTVAYRRTARQMPAHQEELALAIDDGVLFRELLAPVSWENGMLRLQCMKLGAPDASGRQSPTPTGETVVLPADSVIAATGEKVDSALMASLGVRLGERGLPTQSKQSERLYVLGDALHGPATVVEAIADALAVAKDILGFIPRDRACESDSQTLLARRGVLQNAQPAQSEFDRCLGCGKLCLNCVDVCPNRANIAVILDGRPQVVHLEALCNECGNCAAFCPYEGAPYREKPVFENGTLRAGEKGEEPPTALLAALHEQAPWLWQGGASC